MVKKQETEKVKVECSDKLCPVHGKNKLKTRGRTFEGTVTKKLPGRVSIEFVRMIKIQKYERYEKRKTKLHSRLPECLDSQIQVGDLVQVAETRPISKMIHSVVLKKIRGESKK